MRYLPLFAALVAATACAPTPDAQVTKSRAVAPAAAVEAFVAPKVDVTPMSAAMPRRGAYSSAELAANFIELGFQLESGRKLPWFSRFEGTVTVAMTGAVPGSAQGDLNRLIARLRSEAGIDIRPAVSGEVPSITIEFSPRAELRRIAPNAACFVVPNVSTLKDYSARRGTAAVDWAVVQQRRQAAIFLPADSSAQEVRDCLHEELAQALGPLNDLYRLSDSVFNDDNFHTVLTPTDMIMLRAWYSPQLRSGMTQAEVQGRIQGIMSAYGGASAGSDSSPTPRAWSREIETALGGGGSQGARRQAAEKALTMAQSQGWNDGRLAFSHFAVARLNLSSDRARAVSEFSKAAAIYRRLPGGAVQVAHIDMQLAAIALASGQPEQALRFTERALPVAKGAENHGLVATIQLIRAEALETAGRGTEAASLRVDSETHARYGFGSDAQIRARKREITALASRW